VSVLNCTHYLRIAYSTMTSISFTRSGGSWMTRGALWVGRRAMISGLPMRLEKGLNTPHLLAEMSRTHPHAPEAHRALRHAYPPRAGWHSFCYPSPSGEGCEPRRGRDLRTSLWQTQLTPFVEVYI